MANTNDFKVILEAMIDNSSLTNVQKQLAKERLKINADISIEDFAKSKQELEKQIGKLAENIQKILGNAVTDKQASQWAKQYYDGMVSGAKEAEKAQNALTDAMARGREKAEQARIAEEKASNKRQQLAAANAVNKELEEEYKQRQKNIEAAKKQAELDKQNALAFTKSASERLSSAISKYSYGDTSDANAMMKQMNRGLSNFGDLSNVQGNITQLSSTVDKIIADLKVSHEQSLQALNEEIKVEQTLQSQKDAFNKKNINAIDYEIQKREEEAKAFSSMLQAQMQEQQKVQSEVNKIQHLSDTGHFARQVSDISVEYNKLSSVSKELKNDFTRLNELQEILKNPQVDDSNYREFNTLIEKLKNNMHVLANEQKQAGTYDLGALADQKKIDSLAESVLKFRDNNTKMSKDLRRQFTGIYDSLINDTNITEKQVRELSQEFTNLKLKVREAGQLGQSFGDKMKNAIAKFAEWGFATNIAMEAVQALKKGVTNVIELDTAMVDLQKTANMSAQELEDFYYASNDVAKQMGVTTKEIIDQASAWSRLGYNTAEMATQMAKLSSQFKLISPGMTTDEATDGLVSIMKAYDVDVNNVLDGIMSKVNIIGNKFALSNSDIIAMLQDSVSAMAEGNNTLEETIALETAAFEIAQDRSVGNGFKTVALRLRGLNEETQELDDSLKTISGDLYDLTGVSVMQDANTYKSTYQILKDINEVWDDLTDKTQAEALELMFGKQRANVGAAVLKNFEAAERAMDEMSNSAGNAEAEMAIAMDSIEYKLNILGETGTAVSQNLFNREDMKTVLDGINMVGSAVEWLTDKLGLFGTAGLIGGGILSKNGIG